MSLASNIREEINSLFQELQQAYPRYSIIDIENAFYNYLKGFSVPDDNFDKRLDNECLAVQNFIAQSRPSQFKVRMGNSGPIRYVDCKDSKQYSEFQPHDLLWLHMPVVPASLVEFAKAITTFCHTNNFSYQIKMPNSHFQDNITIGMYDRKDAKALINYVNNTPALAEQIMLSNPLIPHDGLVGVTMNTETSSYERYMCKMIMSYIKSTKGEYSLDGFTKFMVRRFRNGMQASSFTERMQDYFITCGSVCILQDKNFIDNLYTNEFKLPASEFDEYRIEFERGYFKYHKPGSDEVNRDEQYMKWLQLQAYYCIQKMYAEKFGEKPKLDVELTPNFHVYINNAIRDFFTTNTRIHFSGYVDKDIESLLPAFMAYYASQNLMVNEEEVKALEQGFGKRLLVRPTSQQISPCFQIDETVIPSTIPVIRGKSSLMGIEILDGTNSYFNITLLNNGKVRSFHDIFMEIDMKLLCEPETEEGRKYRMALLEAFTSFENLIRIPHEKDGKLGTYVELDIKNSENVSKITAV